MLLLCLGTGVGVTDRHSQCTHWLRNDTGSCMGCGGTAGDRKGRPYEGECTPLKCLAEFAARRRQRNKIIFSRDMCVRENTARAVSVEFVRHRRTNYARGRLGAFWQKNRRFFVRDDKRAVPDRDSPFESVKRVYCAALAALMDSISSGTTLNRSPTIP